MKHFGNLSDVKPKSYPSDGPVTHVRAKLVIEHFDHEELLCREKVLIQETRGVNGYKDHFELEKELMDKYFSNIPGP